MVFILERCLDICYFYAKDKYKKTYKLLNILLLIAYTIIVLYLKQSLHKLFTTPDNNVNIENIKNDVNNKFPNTNQELLYFNDKYIFFKIIDKLKRDKSDKLIIHNNPKVYITKVDNLFNDK